MGTKQENLFGTSRLPADPVSGNVRFDGKTYEPAKDEVRLKGQMLGVRNALAKGDWWTLKSLADFAGGSEAGVSARLRDLRKPRFGGYTIERRRVAGGLYEYRMVK